MQHVLDEYTKKNLIKTRQKCDFPDSVQFFIDGYLIANETRVTRSAGVWGIRCEPRQDCSMIRFTAWTFHPGKEDTVKEWVLYDSPWPDQDGLRSLVAAAIKLIVGLSEEFGDPLGGDTIGPAT